MKVTRVYISGPITNDPEYMIKFTAAENRLRSEGYSVVNPAKVNANLPNDFTHEDYMRVSLAELACCEAIYMLDGWKDSKGAKEEYAYAGKLGLKVVREGLSNVT